MTEERVTYITQLEARIAELEADNRRLRHLDAMPLDALRRYVTHDDRIDNGPLHDEYSVPQYYEDYAEIFEWLNSLDGDA